MIQKHHTCIAFLAGVTSKGAFEPLLQPVQLRDLLQALHRVPELCVLVRAPATGSVGVAGEQSD